MNSMIRLFARVSVSHCGRSFLFVQLHANKKGEKKGSIYQRPAQSAPYDCDAQSTKEKRVHPRKGLHHDFDGPGIIIVQKASQHIQGLQRNWRR